MNLNKSLLLATLPLLIITGCGNPSDTPLKAAAQVNGQPIAALQIDSELKKLGEVPADQQQTLANRLLGNLVDQELLAQQAIRSKLDESDELKMKIEAVRRQWLAEAQVATLTKDIPVPSDAEIKAYYEQHPELFANRRIYQLQELMIGSTPENQEKVQGLIAQAKHPQALVESLKAEGIQVAGRQSVKGAEELPSELLARLKDMNPGQSLTLGKAGKLTVLILAGIEARPVTEAAARDMITRYLANAKKREKVEAELVKLRSQAKVEYQPPFAAAAPENK
ncbi:MAG: EpsD family peptidyl-prolyl cis-trans isomerase [Pseudomonadota bacterium]